MPAAMIESLYLGFFGRPAEGTALDYWERYVEQSQASLDGLRQAFASSGEFQALAGQGSAVLVDQVYLNLFGHHPDAAGLAYWRGALDHGQLTPALLAEAVTAGALGADAVAFRDKLVAAQAFSAVWDLRSEIVHVGPGNDAAIAKTFVDAVVDGATLNLALDNLYETVTGGVEGLLPIPDGGHMSPKHGTGLIEQWFVGFLGHAADRSGMAFWEQALEHGSSGAEIQQAFADSADFRALAAKGNAELVNHLYQNLFGRAADPAGLSYWSSALDAGAIGAGQVVGSLVAAASGSDAEALRAKIAAATAFTAATTMLGDTTMSYLIQDTGFVAGVKSDADLNHALDQLYELINVGPVFYSL